MSLRLLVADCEAASTRDERRESLGRSSGETYAATLVELEPGAACTVVHPVDGYEAPDRAAIARYDAVFLSGSSLHLYEDKPETRRLVGFMREVFASGVPAFGSCAGLQLATVAAGGTVRANSSGAEAPIAHRITLTEEGRTHPLLAGRPPVYDALSIHSDEVEALPEGAVRLAGNAVTNVQAAEIRLDGGIFWGVQYHPELPAEEFARSLSNQAEDLVEQGAARTTDALRSQAERLAPLDGPAAAAALDDAEPGSRQLLGPELRRLELRNFLDRLVKPARARRREADPARTPAAIRHEGFAAR